MYFISERRKIVVVSILTAVMIAFSALASFATFSFNPDSYEDESIYNYLRVEDDGEDIILSTNVLIGVQSITKRDKKIAGDYDFESRIFPFYYDYALACPYMAGAQDDDEFDVLVLGMGTGTFATECHYYFENSHITGVEIDEKIIDLAYEKFGLPDDERISCVEFDARAYLRNAGKYDVIMVDAYRDITVQFQLSSVEFFTEVKERLNENGVMVLNLNMTSNSKGSINDYLRDTVSSVFDGNVYTAQAGENIVVFASKDPNFVDNFRDSYPKTADALVADGYSYEDSKNFVNAMKYIDMSLKPYEAGDLILTDDKAPVELLGMKVVDEIISTQLAYYKKAFEGLSIKEMIDMLQ
jgi:spermidine synthase